MVISRQDPYSAFSNGFHGFCTVFVTASFAYAGTELTGLAAAEARNPRKEIPRACKQVIWRIGLFYILSLFIVGLIVPADSPLYQTEGSDSRRSPFVIAIQLAGVKALPSIFNAMILVSVLSVANSATFASTRTFQALAQNGETGLDIGGLLQANISQEWVRSCLHTLTSMAVRLWSCFCSCFSRAWHF